MDRTPASLPPDQAGRRTARVRWFKRTIILATLALSASVVAAFPTGRLYAVESWRAARAFVVRAATGLGPSRSDVEEHWARRRALAVERTSQVLRRFYDESDEPMKELFRVAGMQPATGLIRWGRADQTFLLSAQVFEADDRGRSYRLRPGVRSVWLRGITLRNGPFGLLQVLDGPAGRAAAARVGGVVVEDSVTTTNSWGLRGPEPDPSAPLRGIVLGDSFMQGMLIADDETPPVHLGAKLSQATGMAVSLANTGHVGYSPEQEYYTLLEYADRMRPHFVVMSVCPNDFDSAFDIDKGRPDWLDEGAYWVGLIQDWCRTRQVTFLLVPVPTYPQVEHRRKDGFYPGLVSNLFNALPWQYCDPLERFIDEELRLRREARAAGRYYARSALYNREIDDEHFSPRGAALWAEVVARRLSLLLPPAAGSTVPPPATSAVTSRPSATGPLR